MTDIVYDHEDGVERMLGQLTADGTTPLYILYSSDDETYFISRSPITVQRLNDELPTDITKNFDITSTTS